MLSHHPSSQSLIIAPLTPAKVRLVPTRPHELAHSQHTTPNPHQPSPPHPAPPKIKILLLTRVSPSHHASPSSPPLTPPPFTLPLFPYPIFLSFPLILSTLPSSYPSSLSKSLPPPNTNFLTYTHPVPPSLPRSIEIGKTLQRQALPERTGTVDIISFPSSRHRLGSAGLGLG